MPTITKVLRLTQSRRPMPGGTKGYLIALIVSFVIGSGIMLLCGMPPLFALALILLGTAIGFTGCILPSFFGVFLLGGSLIGGAIVLKHWPVWIYLAWLSSVSVGIFLWNLVADIYIAKSKRTRASVRLAWDEGKQRPDLDAPSWGVVQARIEGLRGGDRSMLTVFNGQKRLDICCTAPDKFLVIFTAALGHDREDVYQAVPISPAAADPRDLIEVEFGGLAGRYPAGRFVPQATAITAARAFLTSGERDGSVIWDRETRHHEIVKPPTLPQS
ncbi:MAG: Imm1 family immunity protein [Leifsonia sp.]